MKVEYEPRFLDEVVLRAAATRPEGRLFYRARERLYGIADPEERARGFEALSAVWYERFGLGAPLTAVLAEQPLVTAGVARCAVGRAPQRQDAGAELLVRPSRPGETGPAGRILRFLLTPEMLLDRGGLFAFLRRELLHVADMLDPRFGYEPCLPAGNGGAAHERLLRDRYRVLWDVTVDGRLVRTGYLPGLVRGQRWDEFRQTFPALDEEAADLFAALFDHPAPTHAALVALATEPALAEHGPCVGAAIAARSTGRPSSS